ncbi:MAG: ABC transporter permease [candidate division NC10 bacterium]|nr:ABC transporter permease [candidate division NC10 bacterium]
MLTKTIYPIIQHRELIWEMALRDLKAMNKGAFLGYLWLVISPLVQVAAYVLIVSFVFRSRLGEGSGSFDYALYVLAGIIPWQIMARSVQEAPSLIRERMELVKQVIYPIETLPLTSLIVSSFGSLVSFGLFLVLTLIAGSFHWTFFLLPILFLLLAVFVLGISWIFSIVGVLIKDLREIVTVLLGLLIYLSPVVLSREMVGERIWGYILWNPLSHIIICFRDVFEARFHLWSWAIYAAISLLALLVGDWVITRTKLLINEYI